MPDNRESRTPSVPELQARLQDVGRLLKQSDALDPESRLALMELVAELKKALAGGEVPAAEVTHLAESTAQLAEALRHPPDRGLLVKARDRLERAVGRAEAEAPDAVDLARRVLEALADLGI
jgi:hypothetical protein